APNPDLLLSACIAYFTAGVLMLIARRLAWPSLRRVALVNAGVDTVAIALILYTAGGVASGLGILLVLPVGATAMLAYHRDALLLYTAGGVASGLGILLVLPVGATAMLAYHRDALLIAALAALGVLGQQTLAHLHDIAPGTDFTTAGVLGVVLFGVALSVWPV